MRVLIAEDHPLMLEAIVARIEQADDLDVVATVGDGAALVTAYEEHHPDVVLSDCAMPTMDGIAAARAIKAFDPAARIVILSAHDDQTTLSQALEAGAIGYLVKSMPTRELCARVRAAGNGEPTFDADATRLLFAELRTPTRTASGRGVEPGALSDREVEVLRLVANGLSNGEIGHELSISAQTVKTHMERIFSKLGVHSRAAAVKESMARGLV